MNRLYWLTDIPPEAAFSQERIYVEHGPIRADAVSFTVTAVIEESLSRHELKTILEMEFVNSSGQVLMFQRMYIDTKEQLTLFYAVPFVPDSTPSACVIALMQANTETLNRLAV